MSEEQQFEFSFDGWPTGEVRAAEVNDAAGEAILAFAIDVVVNQDITCDEALVMRQDQFVCEIEVEVALDPNAFFAVAVRVPDRWCRKHPDIELLAKTIHRFDGSIDGPEVFEYSGNGLRKGNLRSFMPHPKICFREVTEDSVHIDHDT